MLVGALFQTAVGLALELACKFKEAVATPHGAAGLLAPLTTGLKDGGTAMLMTIQHHLADNLQSDGQHAGSLEVYDELLRAGIGLFGHNHPVVASTYNNIGEVYRHQAKYLEALEMYDKSLKIEIKVHSPDHQLGPEHPGTAATQKNIGIVLEKSRQVPGAAQTVQHVPQDPQKKCSAATTRSWPTHTTSKNPADLPFSPSFSILCSTVFMQHRKCAGRPG